MCQRSIRFTAIAWSQVVLWFKDIQRTSEINITPHFFEVQTCKARLAFFNLANIPRLSHVTCYMSKKLVEVLLVVWQCVTCEICWGIARSNACHQSQPIMVWIPLNQMGPGACFIPELVRHSSHQDVHAKLFLHFNTMIPMMTDNIWWFMIYYNKHCVSIAFLYGSGPKVILELAVQL